MATGTEPLTGSRNLASLCREDARLAIHPSTGESAAARRNNSRHSLSGAASYLRRACCRLTQMGCRWERIHRLSRRAWRAHFGAQSSDSSRGGHDANRKGVHYGSCHSLEVEWAELIQQMIPAAEQFGFTVTGTEAHPSGVRISRAFTGETRLSGLPATSTGGMIM